jgi:signal transduction histidine kinase
MVVHDLQGPIASMKTLVRFLASNKYNPENDVHAALVRSSKNAIERSESIIFDLVNAAAADAIGIYPEIGEYDLCEIIADSICVLGGSALDYGVSVQTALRKTPIKVMANRNYLLRVMDNLLY